jgi:hypothetical protein
LVLAPRFQPSRVQRTCCPISELAGFPPANICIRYVVGSSGGPGTERNGPIHADDILAVWVLKKFDCKSKPMRSFPAYRPSNTPPCPDQTLHHHHGLRRPSRRHFPGHQRDGTIPLSTHSHWRCHKPPLTRPFSSRYARLSVRTSKTPYIMRTLSCARSVWMRTSRTRVWSAFSATRLSEYTLRTTLTPLWLHTAWGLPG